MTTKLKEVDLVVCLDSSACETTRLWMTGSLRGIVNCDLTVKMLNDPVHSGDAGGIVPETFRICRHLLNRLDSPKDGSMIEEFNVKIPESRIKEAKELSSLFGKLAYSHYPWLPGTLPVTEDVTELLLNRTWRPCLAVTGADGLPEISKAGNVLRISTSLKLSIRLPPTLKSEPTGLKVKEILEKDPPYGAEVKVSNVVCADGWNANDYPPKFHELISNASKVFDLVNKIEYLQK